MYDNAGETMAEDIKALRDALIKFIARKFSGRESILLHAEDIVDEAYSAVLAGASYSPDKENFGYLSVAALRVAYKYWKGRDVEKGRRAPYSEALACVDSGDFADELVRAEDAGSVLDSLDCLKRIERTVIEQRYYGNYTFAEIAARNGINLNTVLSRHRRALERLRLNLSRYF